MQDAAKFWAYFLKKSLLPWENNIRKVIQITLALGVGSADVERAVSVMNHISYDSRSRLSISHIDSLARVRINGPNLEHFNHQPYVKHWLLKHMHTDDEMKTKTQKDSVNENKYNSKLF